MSNYTALRSLHQLLLDAHKMQEMACTNAISAATSYLEEWADQHVITWTGQAKHRSYSDIDSKVGEALAKAYGVTPEEVVDLIVNQLNLAWMKKTNGREMTFPNPPVLSSNGQFPMYFPVYLYAVNA